MGMTLYINTAQGVIFDRENAFQLKQFLAKENKKTHFTKRELQPSTVLNHFFDDIVVAFNSQYPNLGIHSSFDYYNDKDNLDAIIIYAPSTLTDVNPLNGRIKPFAFTEEKFGVITSEEKADFERLYASFKEDAEVMDPCPVFWAEVDV